MIHNNSNNKLSDKQKFILSWFLNTAFNVAKIGKKKILNIFSIVIHRHEFRTDGNKKIISLNELSTEKNVHEIYANHFFIVLVYSQRYYIYYLPNAKNRFSYFHVNFACVYVCMYACVCVRQLVISDSEL